MKHIIRNVVALSVIIMFSSLVFFSGSCSKSSPSVAVITVVDSLNRPVAGATVKLTAPSNGRALASYLPEVQVSGGDGKSYHSFPLEAVLTAEVSKGNLMVYDIVRLKKDDTINQTIILK